ncbi:single-stranded DNA-binding protein [Methylocystis sp.]|uniref:single-stranded DNA-binding protein n=1 Tax=Methylocystis sp. TaxID=1911079 RepID=UPI0025EC39AD|nr:single-stranded DNA-binding protein [Methylocystis sp.]
MTVHALITGTLFRAPEQRISKAGKPFWSATIRVKDGDVTQWWKLLIFSESTGAELMRLGDGDAVSAQGVFKAEPYDKDGETRVGFTLFAESVLPLKPAPRERKPKAEKPRESWAAPDRMRDDRPRVDADLDDQIPF